MQLRSIETDARDEVYLLLQLHLGDGVYDYAAAVRKRRQLDREIRASGASAAAIANMLHTLSKLWMFLSEFIPEKVKDEWMEQKQDSDGLD